MVMRRRIGDAEADDDLVEKLWLGQVDADAAQISSGLKHQFIGADCQRVPLKERRVTTSVLVRDRARRFFAAGSIAKQSDCEPGRGAAQRSV